MSFKLRRLFSVYVRLHLCLQSALLRAGCVRCRKPAELMLILADGTSV